MLELEVDKRATTRMFNIMEVKFDDMFRDVWYNINNEHYTKDKVDSKIKGVAKYMADNYNTTVRYENFEHNCNKWFDKIEAWHERDGKLFERMKEQIQKAEE